MIGLLRGEVVRKDAESLLLLTGGVGYQLRMPVDALCDLPLGETTELHVHTHVRDDAIELFGFTTLYQLRLFEKLLGIQKVGPRLALALLSSLPPQGVVTAIREGDTALLSRTPGIGKKTAERLVLELSDKLEDLIPEGDDGAPAAGAAVTDVVSALVNLGYPRQQAEQAAAAARKDADDEAPLEEILRAALRRLAG